MLWEIDAFYTFFTICCLGRGLICVMLVFQKEPQQTAKQVTVSILSLHNAKRMVASNTALPIGVLSTYQAIKCR